MERSGGQFPLIDEPVMRTLIVLLIVATATMSSAVGQDADYVNGALVGIFGSHEKFEAAFETLQAAVEEVDAETVADLAAYPLLVKIDGRLEIGSAADFVASYDRIIPDDIATVIAKQRYGDLIVNQDGVGFGNGQLWLNGVCEDDTCAVWDVKIVAIQRTDE